VTAINNQKSVNGGTLPGGWTASANGNSLRFKTDHRPGRPPAGQE
jgi:hypothetical protein